MIETWAAIPEYEGIYEASDRGRIRRICYIPNARPVPYYLAELGHPGGYRMVALHKDKKQRHRLIHRLVMAAFHGPSALEVNHKDGNKRNNALDNLEYVTPKQNGEHASRTGLTPRGSRAPWSKMNEDKVREARRLHKLGDKKANIARHFGVSYMTIQLILQGKTWRHVTN